MVSSGIDADGMVAVDGAGEDGAREVVEEQALDGALHRTSTKLGIVALARQQVEGGVVMGMSHRMLEGLIYDDEGHLLVVFREYPNESSNYIVTATPGYDAETQVMDEQAREILLDYIDYYYTDTDLSEGQFFQRAFTKAADRIMTKQLSNKQLITIVAVVAVVVIGIIIVASIIRKKKVAVAKQKALQKQAEASPLRHHATLTSNILISLSCIAEKVTLVIIVIATVRTYEEQAVTQQFLLVPECYTASNSCIKATGLLLHPPHDIRRSSQFAFRQKACGKGFRQHIEVGPPLFVQQGHQPLEILLRLRPMPVPGTLCRAK